MDDRFRAILDHLAEVPARSSLEPYRELIDELRRRGRTFRDIAHILAQECGVRVSASTVFRFVRTRPRVKPKRQRQKFLGDGRSTIPTQSPAPDFGHTNVTALPVTVGSSEIHQRIASLKSRPTAQPEPTPFQYDPEEPLTLPPKANK